MKLSPLPNVSTVVIQIGNSDDKLTQKRWHDFIRMVRLVLYENATTFHFDAGSPGDTTWQNWCFVCQFNEPDRIALTIDSLKQLGAMFNQESIAVMVGANINHKCYN